MKYQDVSWYHTLLIREVDILQLGEPTETQKWHFIKFFENGIAKWISNLLNRDQIFTTVRSKFTKSWSNLLSRDQIYYLKSEIC